MGQSARMKTLTTCASLALLVAGLAGCGGGSASSAPDDASQADFCDAYVSQIEALMRSDPAENADDSVRRMQDWAGEMAEVGTPEGMPADARRGFETLLEEVESIDPDAGQEELDALGDELGKDAQRDVEAFGAYTIRACPEAMEQLMGGLGDQLDEQMGELEDQLGDLEGDLGDLDLGDLTETPAG